MKRKLNEVRKLQKVAGILKESEYEASQLEEAELSDLDNSVAALYAYTKIDPNYDYDERLVKRFGGQDVIDRAIEIAPKVLAYKEKLKQIAAEIESSEEGKILLAMISHRKGHGGSPHESNIGDLFRL